MPKITLSDLSAPVLIALLKRALADRRHASQAIRDEAEIFIGRVCGIWP